VARCQHFAPRFRYVLKADVQKFFPSVDPEAAPATNRRRRPPSG
jgi:hypothetical protein